jgi:hypothetical protein
VNHSTGQAATYFFNNLLGARPFSVLLVVLRSVAQGGRADNLRGAGDFGGFDMGGRFGGFCSPSREAKDVTDVVSAGREADPAA